MGHSMWKVNNISEGLSARVSRVHRDTFSSCSIRSYLSCVSTWWCSQLYSFVMSYSLSEQANTILSTGATLSKKEPFMYVKGWVFISSNILFLTILSHQVSSQLVTSISHPELLRHFLAPFSWFLPSMKKFSWQRRKH